MYLSYGMGKREGERRGREKRKEGDERIKKNSTEEREGRKKKADYMLPSKTTHVK